MTAPRGAADPAVPAAAAPGPAPVAEPGPVEAAAPKPATGPESGATAPAAREVTQLTAEASRHHRRSMRQSLGAWWWQGLLLVIGVAVILAGRALIGGFLLAGSFLLAAALRVLLPNARSGALAVRSRAFDVTFSLLVAGLVLAAFLAADLRPR